MHSSDHENLNSSANQEPEATYLKNVRYIEKAKKYCREIIPVEGSFTHPSQVNNFITNNIFYKVKAMRKRQLKLADYLPHILIDSQEKLINLKEWVKKLKEDKLGNCGELSDLAMNFLRKKDIKRIEKLTIVGSDHVFIVLDREGDINNRKTWGKSCVIYDVLNDQFFPPTEINQKLQCYCFNYNLLQQGLNPHFLSEFTDSTHLSVERELLCKIDPEDNKKKLDNFYKNLELIVKISNSYLDSKNLEALLTIINQSKIDADKYKIDELTNFKLERLLVKPMKKIIQLIKSDDHHDVIFKEILLATENKEVALVIAVKFHLSQVVENLLNQGADPSLVHSHNHSVFTLAVENGDLDIVKLILDHNAKANLNIDHPDKTGSTALRSAITYNQIEIAKEILLRGARPDLIENDGFSAWHYAACKGNVAMINLMLDYDTSGIVNKKKQDGWTALHLAVTNNYYQMVKDLLFLGADPYISNQDGITPWDIAARDGNLGIIQLILSHDEKENISNINHQKYDGWTALHLAVNNNHYQVVEELLKHGADPYILTNDQLTAYSLVQNQKMLDLINFYTQQRTPHKKI